MLPLASRRHYQAQQRLGLLARSRARQAWRLMGPDFDASWPQVRARLMVLVTGTQAAAAQSGVDYVEQVLAETGQDADPEGTTRPQAFAGTASDGRPLDSLMYGGVTTAKDAVAAGASPTEALAAGGRFVDMAVWTQVADAARQATGVGIASRPAVTGWVRMVNPPCCSRCAVLAGRHYRWNTGFQRHPRCDCTHIPATEGIAGDFTLDPDALARRGQINDLTDAERQALTRGADLGQVVNARRGSQGMTTTEGTTRRGRFRQQTGLRVRLTPEGIYREAVDRADAIRLLRRHGYLT